MCFAVLPTIKLFISTKTTLFTTQAVLLPRLNLQHPVHFIYAGTAQRLSCTRMFPKAIGFQPASITSFNLSHNSRHPSRIFSSTRRHGDENIAISVPLCSKNCPLKTLHTFISHKHLYLYHYSLQTHVVQEFSSKKTTPSVYPLHYY